jgi:hypothetical protein
MEDIIEILQPSDSIEMACKNLLLHSFAIMRVNSETWASLKSAWLASKQFFVQTYSTRRQEETEMSMITKYRKINNFNLLGFNRPSPHKLLFRVMFLNGKPDSTQPWPGVDIDGGALKESSLRLMPCLHDLLCAFLAEIKRQVVVVDDGQRDVENDDGYGQEPSYKKCKIQLEEVNRDTTWTTNGLVDLSYCPLDYFYYHDIKNEPVENCSEHIDRGLLICISLTNVAGLEVLSRKDGIWYCPEMVSICESHYSDNETGCSDLICILSGDQLRKEVCNAEITSGVEEERFPGLNACIHRVKQKLSACRLSITYEIRQP